MEARRKSAVDKRNIILPVGKTRVSRKSAAKKHLQIRRIHIPVSLHPMHGNMLCSGRYNNLESGSLQPGFMRFRLFFALFFVKKRKNKVTLTQQNETGKDKTGQKRTGTFIMQTTKKRHKRKTTCAVHSPRNPPSPDKRFPPKTLIRPP